MLNRFALAVALTLAAPVSCLMTPATHAQTQVVPSDDEDEEASINGGGEETPEQPLTQEDIDLYLKVMRAAAQKVKELPAADRTILEKVAAAQAGKADMTSLKPQDIQRAAALSTIDEQVAAETGVLDRYKNIPSQISLRSSSTCELCGRDPSEGPDQEDMKNPPRPITAAELKQREAEVALVKAHRKEIVALERRVHPLSPWATMP